MTMRTSSSPASSRTHRASRLSAATSPLSSRSAATRRPLARSSRATSAVIQTPCGVSYVSTSNVTGSLRTRAHASNAARSFGMASMKACATVPKVGMPSNLLASTLLVPSKPTSQLARASASPPSIPGALRRSKSTTGLPRAAATHRAAFVATTVG